LLSSARIDVDELHLPGGGSEGELAGLALAMPVDAVFFLGIGHGLIADELLQDVEVHRVPLFAFGEEFREEFLKFGDILGDEVGRFRFGRIGCDFLHEN
jgi:hypothetical protein